ncbi:MAG TPA: hypothetical protein EYN89_07125, partial [Flavobacteriales bacterium]|nr:hypothetical protein [Flavobacteriales bacterium]
NRLIMIQRQRNIIRGHKELVALQNKDIVDSIQYAKLIQKSVLPSQKQFRDVFPDSFILYNPKDIISGDFYWLYEAGDTVYFSVSDCPGRGVPGAFMSIIGSSLLNDAISSKGLSQPSEILDEVKNEYVRALELSAENTLSGDDMKAVLCAWDKNGAMQYAAANMSLLIIRDGQVIETHSDNRGIGFSLGPPLPFTNHSISLKKGDTLYMYSDGYQNQFGGEKGKKFRVKKLRSLLAGNSGEPMEKQQHILEATIENWRGSTEQVDDILVMGLKLN